MGSGSRGNAIAFCGTNGAVLVDAGFGFRTLVSRAKQAGVDLRSLRAIVLTHEHGDHARGAMGIARRRACPLYASRGTLRALDTEGVDARVIEPERSMVVGTFAVTACRTDHDAAEPLCVAVEDPRAGVKVGVAYDLGRPTEAVRRLLASCTCLIVEANHDEQLLRAGPYPPSVQHRIASATGHLSNRATARFLAQLCHRRLTTVVLAHLSDQCNRPDLAREIVHRALSTRGFRGRLLVASQDEPLLALRGTVTAQLSLAI